MLVVILYNVTRFYDMYHSIGLTDIMLYLYIMCWYTFSLMRINYSHSGVNIVIYLSIYKFKKVTCWFVCSWRPDGGRTDGRYIKLRRSRD